MRAVIQRVTSSEVAVDGEIKGKISKGFNVLLGVMKGDTKAQADLLAGKIARLRVFEDEEEKMNLSILDVDGEVLAISQFTLCADCRKGRRPNFIGAAPPDEANGLYEYFCECMKRSGIEKVERGIFGADMKVSLLNDGPVTIILDSAQLA